MSFAKAYFDCPVYQQDLKVAEAQQKLDLAVVGRLDVVIKAIGQLGKALTGRR